MNGRTGGDFGGKRSTLPVPPFTVRELSLCQEPYSLGQRLGAVLGTRQMMIKRWVRKVSSIQQ